MTDIVILGGGPGGYAAALYAHNYGLSVTLVEKERLGGTCLIRGCIPAKHWLQVAAVYSTVANAADFGVVASQPSLDWEAALARKNRTVEGLVRGVTGLLRKRDVKLIEGYGRISGPGRVQVGDGQIVEGDSVILATGSHARSIPGYDIDGSRIVTSDHALDWDSQPRRVAIIGAGAIGCEFASMLIDVGTEVHVFEMLDQVVPGTDAASAKMLQRQLQNRGVKFHLGAGVGPPEKGLYSVRVPYRDESVEVDTVLVAVGRGPNTTDVGLETTAAVVDRGYVLVDENQQTAERGLYAVGDIVAGTPQLAHAGFAEAIAAVTHIATGESRPVDHRAIPRVTYTHPEVAEVGVTEAEAAEQGLDISVTTHGFGGVGRAIIIGQDQGQAKLVALKDGPIIGASVVGPQAGEMIHEMMYLVGWEAMPAEAAEFIHAHPTLSEAVGETLLSSAGARLH